MNYPQALIKICLGVQESINGIRKLTAYCLSKPHSIEDYPFGPEPAAIKVATEMFALISVKDGKCFVSLKCDPFMAQSLREQYSTITPGYHLNKDHWARNVAV